MGAFKYYVSAFDQKSRENDTNNHYTNRILPESWINSITERPDASKIFLILTKSVFKNIKRNIKWSSSKSSYIQVLLQSVLIALTWGGGPKLWKTC